VGRRRESQPLRDTPLPRTLVWQGNAFVMLLPRPRARPSLDLPWSRASQGFLLCPRSFRVRQGAGGGGDSHEGYRHERSIYGGEGMGARNPSTSGPPFCRIIREYGSTVHKFLAAFPRSRLPLSGPGSLREKKGAQLPLCDAARACRMPHPCPQIAQCCFGNGMKRLTIADSHYCLIIYAP
jgi:hypothetical protein